MALFVLALSACKQSPETQPALQTTDSLSQMWIDAWNVKDVDAIAACFTQDALLITDTAYIGIDAIKSEFILKAAPYFQNLSCKKIYESISGAMAYQAGSYNHEWIINDSTVEQAKGYYTMVWKMVDDKTWQMVVFQTN